MLVPYHYYSHDALIFKNHADDGYITKIISFKELFGCFSHRYFSYSLLDAFYKLASVNV